MSPKSLVLATVVLILRDWSELVTVAAQPTGSYHLQRILTGHPGDTPPCPERYDRLPCVTDFDAYGTPNDEPDTLDRLTPYPLAALAATRLETAR
ncbi:MULTISPECIES: hypothetical protein [Nocardia]|uniref:hypothetical protein n=1 Tax=Nocardia TaxID=1817 RepID=UPI000D690749|nr:MULTISPECIES: hypothetical protein [Nocardia]